MAHQIVAEGISCGVGDCQVTSCCLLHIGSHRRRHKQRPQTNQPIADLTLVLDLDDREDAHPTTISQGFALAGKALANLGEAVVAQAEELVSASQRADMAEGKLNELRSDLEASLRQAHEQGKHDGRQEAADDLEASQQLLEELESKLNSATDRIGKLESSNRDLARQQTQKEPASNGLKPRREIDYVLRRAMEMGWTVEKNGHIKLIPPMIVVRSTASDHRGWDNALARIRSLDITK